MHPQQVQVLHHVQGSDLRMSPMEWIEEDLKELAESDPDARLAVEAGTAHFYKGKATAL